ncbi:hypothetical protein CRG98_011032 [Punica granatum]|uniref:Uncharacterized protein n=1 Tax=Punica granatum TaxID=22663 RepID=A0A2I0KL56_PUNGR|nr:hypothetical protein CRG98_011032 [Punica granatum]
MNPDPIGRRLRRGCSRFYGARDQWFTGAALGCVEERSRARVSDMGRESGEEGDVQIRTRPDSPRHPNLNQLVTNHEAPRQHLTATWHGGNDQLDLGPKVSLFQTF